MSNRNHIVILAVLALGLHLLFSPSAFPMGLGNNPPVISSVTANPNPTSPGGQSLLTCIASDSDGTITKYEWTADGGTFPNGTATEIVLAPENTIVWTAPLDAGYYNITIKVYDNGSAYSPTPATATTYLTILVDGGNNSPVITSVVPEVDSVFVGASIFVIASATDPDGDPLTFQWTASGGTISGDDDVDPEAIIWTAPQTGGSYTITVTVTDGRGGESSQSVSVQAVVANSGGFINTPFANPVRIATDSLGQIYVSDTHKNRILVYDQVGTFVREIGGLEEPLAVAVGGNGNLYVGEDGKDQVSIYSPSGTFLGALSGPPVEMPNSIEMDPSLGLIFVADSKAAQVLVFSSSGTFQYSIDGSLAVSGGFIFPVGVGVDAANQTIYVSDAGAFKVYGLDYSGNLKSSFGSMGRGPGKFSRPQGVAVDTLGRIFAVDSYQSYVQVFNSSGQFLASIGSFGDAKGNLSIPLDAQVDQFDRLLVTSNDNSRIEVFDLTDDTIPLPNTPPTAPAPYLPADNVQVATYNPDLAVLPATDPEGDVLSYDFEVYELGQVDPYASTTGIPEAPDQIDWFVQPALQENTYYEWRARAFDGVDAGPWTSTRVFYVNAVNALPSTPEEILTQPGAELRPDGVLEWTGSSDPDAFDQITYVVEIDDDADFSSVLIRQENIQATSIPLESLDQYGLLTDDTWYYWRVKAVDNAGGESAWVQGEFYFNRIEIEVSSTPEGAEVYIDGNPAYPGWKVDSGVTPITVANVQETLHTVTIKKAGFELFQAIADNRNGSDAEIFATLKPAAPVALGIPFSIDLSSVMPGVAITRSRPFLIDWNRDGIVDVLLSDGSGAVHLLLGAPPSAGVPATLTYWGILVDPSALFGISCSNAVVFAVDWDNDADDDLLIGNGAGTVFLAINAGTQETPDFTAGGKIQVLGQDLTLLADTAPAVVDWNNDGKKDLLVGCSTGIIGLYINAGTDEAPVFDSEQFVEVDGARLVIPTGNAVPFVTDWNNDGLDDLLIGTRGGQTYLYLNIGTPGNPILQDQKAVHYFFNKKKEVEANAGSYSTPYLYDWDGDGLRDLISGNENGEVISFPGIEP